MKKRLLVIFLLSCSLFSVELKVLQAPAFAAINNLLHRDFASFSGRVDFVSCGKHNGLIDQLLRHVDGSLSIQVKSCVAEQITLSTSSVVIFDSPENFEETIDRISWRYHNSTQYRHMVYIRNGTTRDIEDAIKDGWSLEKVAFLVNETEKSIDLATSFMFTEEKCCQNQLVTINTFRKDTTEWENDNFFPEKYQNMHSCTLKQLTMDSYGSLGFKVMREMSEKLNFKVHTTKVDSWEKFSKSLKNHFYDFHDISSSLGDFNQAHLFVASEQTAFVIPDGTSLSSLEKLLSPFDTEVWIGILATMAITFVAVQVISLSSKKLRDKCFGQAVGSPTMNLLNVFLCGGQTKVPETDTAKYIFLNFLVWTLIIRTCFQSLSYRALQLDSRHPPMKTFEDLRANNFTQYVYADMNYSSEDIEKYFPK